MYLFILYGCNFRFKGKWMKANNSTKRHFLITHSLNCQYSRTFFGRLRQRLFLNSLWTFRWHISFWNKVVRSAFAELYIIVQLNYPLIYLPRETTPFVLLAVGSQAATLIVWLYQLLVILQPLETDFCLLSTKK